MTDWTNSLVNIDIQTIRHLRRSYKEIMTDSIKAVKKVLDFKAIDKTTGTILGEKTA